MMDFTRYRPYAGIGSRSTPRDVEVLMEGLAEILATAGFTLRSGAAMGADSAFEHGCDEHHGQKEIYIPWNGYAPDPRNPEYKRWASEPGVVAGVDQTALALASQYHPAWSACSQGAQKLLARNGYQVLGRYLDSPAKFIVFWAPEDIERNVQGGTGQAVRLAHAREIPTFNLKVDGDIHRLHLLLDEMEL